MMRFRPLCHIPQDRAFFFMTHLMPGKQHSRRFPDASISQAFSIRRRRVSGCLASVIENIQSRRAIGVMFAHESLAEGFIARALRRSIGTLVSGSSPARVISTVTVSKAAAPTASRMASLTLNRRLPLSSDSIAARKGKVLIVPSTIIISRDGSLALAFLGIIRAVSSSLALKRIVGLVFCGFAGLMPCFIYCYTIVTSKTLNPVCSTATILIS
jgi:hypothetical protein